MNTDVYNTGVRHSVKSVNDRKSALKLKPHLPRITAKPTLHLLCMKHRALFGFQIKK